METKTEVRITTACPKCRINIHHVLQKELRIFEDGNVTCPACKTRLQVETDVDDIVFYRVRKCNP
jgi:uncharacterized protein YbaR (Trm112 family)